ncbi:MAG: type secretion system protein, partial [Gemmatimonadetes bacterium]|nr:type secretion system protein [Gemmatimonadota bacterium]
IRFRVDGALHDFQSLPRSLAAPISSRLKILANMDIVDRHRSQDGQIAVELDGRAIDIRVATVETIWGEKVVLRLLDRSRSLVPLTDLGLGHLEQDRMRRIIGSPYGLLIVSGPTGAGKTTTLYSALSKVNNIDVNIMTAEDPVEYNLYGVNQVLVRNEVGMTFAAALKAFLRQDPNIIMVGEIRDLETGGIAIKAALTGHLVLSTLHTNSAAETITRLMDMGLEPFNVASALNLVLAQRLLRRVCGNCKEPFKPTALELDGAKVLPTTTLRELRFTEEALEAAKARTTKEAKQYLEKYTLDTTFGEMTFFKGKGCEQCAGTGMKGRQGVYEVMPMTPKMRKLIMMNVGAAEIRDGAVDEGMLTLRMDAWMKVMKGITTLEQIIRETTP